MKVDRARLWRKTSGILGVITSATLAIIAATMYKRYFGPVPSRVIYIQAHATALTTLYRLCSYGSLVTLLLSLLGRGALRIIGSVLTLVTIFYTLAILGAWCGPFMC